MDSLTLYSWLTSGISATSNTLSIYYKLMSHRDMKNQLKESIEMRYFTVGLIQRVLNSEKTILCQSSWGVITRSEIQIWRIDA